MALSSDIANRYIQLVMLCHDVYAILRVAFAVLVINQFRQLQGV